MSFSKQLVVLERFTEIQQTENFLDFPRFDDQLGLTRRNCLKIAGFSAAAGTGIFRARPAHADPTIGAMFAMAAIGWLVKQVLDCVLESYKTYKLDTVKANQNFHYQTHTPVILNLTIDNRPVYVPRPIRKEEYGFEYKLDSDNQRLTRPLHRRIASEHEWDSDLNEIEANWAKSNEKPGLHPKSERLSFPGDAPGYHINNSKDAVRKVLLNTENTDPDEWLIMASRMYGEAGEPDRRGYILHRPADRSPTKKPASALVIMEE